MSTIDPSAQLAAMLRAQAALRREVKLAPSRGPRSSESSTALIKATRQQTMVLRIRALSPEDSQRQRKAFRIFIESVLSKSVGRRLDDCGFDRLVENVLQRMESDAGLDSALCEAGRLLLDGVLPLAQDDAPAPRASD